MFYRTKAYGGLIMSNLSIFRRYSGVCLIQSIVFIFQDTGLESQCLQHLNLWVCFVCICTRFYTSFGGSVEVLVLHSDYFGQVKLHLVRQLQVYGSNIDKNICSSRKTVCKPSSYRPRPVAVSQFFFIVTTMIMILFLWICMLKVIE